MKLFLYRLEAIDTATVYPLLLLATKIWENKQNELNNFLVILESYLVRRMICGMTTKNYNRHFTDVIKDIYRTEKHMNSAIEIVDIHIILSKSESDSSRMPNDAELTESLLKRPLYGRIAQYKIRMILEALDDANQHSKTQIMPIQQNLTIEHLLPEKWEKHWSLSKEGKSADEILEQEALRNILKNTIGNLTLITGSLNPSISNSSWEVKRPEILRYSKSNLNRYFQPQVEDTLSEWNENEILKRSKFLTNLFIKVWKAPLEKTEGTFDDKEDVYFAIDV